MTVLVVLLSGGCVSFQKTEEKHDSAAAEKTAAEAGFDDIAVLTEAMLLVRRNYVEEKPFQDVVYGAINGMLTELDPNSSFLPPQPLADLEEETRGRFSGIGLSVGIDKSGVKVIAPVEDSPAFKAGIHAGDTITAVDGKKLEGSSLDAAVKAMRGEKGSTVKVTVERTNGEKTDIAMVRDDIKLTSVKGIRDLGDGIGYLRITQFNEPVVEDFARVLTGLEKQKITGLIVDLRDNPGGLLESAVGVAEQVLPKGKEIVTVRGRRVEKLQQRFESGPCPRRFTDLPIAVLVNGGSASASEIVAGALQAHKRAVLVGERTYGKASVQSVIKLALRPDCAVRLTTGYYYTPDGKLIHGTGITPDVEVMVPKTEWRQAQRKRLYEEMPGAATGGMEKLMGAAVKDVQLERAKEVLIGARILNNG
ncbi:MAG TPA: S41 family peptidase [Kiritimatiellia bacterium]|nr:S41 family peptidase [Kiritimatiellia bacterium]HPS05972.1 S41 family peptidase [Kiritimatiellia bacterium]